jgi:hypothetical protein
MLPYRDYDEHEVINGLFSAVEGELSAGTLMSIVSCDITKEPVESFLDPSNLGSAANVYTPRWFVPNKIQTATSGAAAREVLGMALYSVQETDNLGRKLIYDPVKKDELNVLLSGEAMPVVKRGLFKINDAGYVGTPAVNSLGTVGEDGKITALTYAELTGAGMTEEYVIGHWVSGPGNVGGYNRSGTAALFYLDV